MTRCVPALHLLLGALILLSPGCAPDPWRSNFPTFGSKEDDASLGKRIARSVPRITSPDNDGTGNPTGSLVMVAPGVGLTARHVLPEILQKTTTVIDGDGETVVIKPTEVTALMVLQDGIFCWVTLLDRSGCWEDLPDEADMPIVGPYQASDWAVVDD